MIYIYTHIHINNGINEISVESNRSIREEPNNFSFCFVSRANFRDDSKV